MSDGCDEPLAFLVRSVDQMAAWEVVRLVTGRSYMSDKFQPLPHRINEWVQAAKLFDTHRPRKPLGT